MLRSWWCLATASALCAAIMLGCVEKSSQGPSDKQLQSQLRLNQKPSPQHPLDIRFENKVRLLGYDIDRPNVVLDRPFTVTWYWQVDQALGEGWQIFTHIDDDKTVNRMNIDANRMVRRVYPVPEWKAGEFIKDPQEITLPKNWNAKVAVFRVGFYDGPHRLHVTTGQADNDNRAEALSLAIAERAPAPKPVLPRLVARRTTAPIKLDGKLDEPDWTQAQSTGAFVNTMTGEPGGFQASASVLYDDKDLYVGFQVQDDYLKSTFKNADDHLWEQDTVEVMIDPDGDAKNYFEIQVSPRGMSFDTRYDAPRDPKPFGHLDWSSQVRAKVTLDGKLDDEDADKGYVVELAMPWSAFAVGATPASAPVTGENWRINFFVMDARKSGQRAVAWSAPKIGDFHTLNKFGRVAFPQAADPAHDVPAVVPAPGSLAPATATTKAAASKASGVPASMTAGAKPMPPSAAQLGAKLGKPAPDKIIKKP